MTVSVPNTPQQLLDMNVSSWEDHVCGQAEDHSPYEVLCLMTRLSTMIEDYVDNRVDKTNYRFNLITLGELSVVSRTLRSIVNDLTPDDEERVLL